jgi:hypothetical protein
MTIIITQNRDGGSNCQKLAGWYNCDMESAQIFRPVTIPRQGERNAWILTGFAVVIQAVLFWRSGKLLCWATLLSVLLMLSAFFISLSNWVDRKTVLILEPEGVIFRSGLRDVKLDWIQIENVRVINDRWGSRVYVSGADRSFNFRMLSEVQIQGRVGGQMGFPEGETILKEILQASDLHLQKTEEQDLYYARS